MSTNKNDNKTFCIVTDCQNTKNRRYILCRKHWNMLPADLRLSVREVDVPHRKGGAMREAEKPMQTLRATPKKSWYESAVKHVGVMKIPQSASRKQNGANSQ